MFKEKRNILQIFGLTVRERRNALGISQEELAERTGLHRTYIGDIELGKRNVSLENIVKLADALGVTPSTLFSEFESKRSKRSNKQ